VAVKAARDTGNAGLLASHDVEQVAARLAVILADLAFPARWWQIITVANLYGADRITRAALARLPERSEFHDVRELAQALASRR
jgi:hypothetical protein